MEKQAHHQQVYEKMEHLYRSCLVRYFSALVNGSEIVLDLCLTLLPFSVTAVEHSVWNSSTFGLRELRIDLKKLCEEQRDSLSSFDVSQFLNLDKLRIGQHSLEVPKISNAYCILRFSMAHHGSLGTELDPRESAFKRGGPWMRSSRQI